MMVKFVSLVSLICAIAILSLNIKDGSDPMFFIVAGGLGANIMRLTLAGLMVFGSFYKMPKRWHIEPQLFLVGALFIAFGVSGFILNSFDFMLYNYIKPLDFLMVAQTGVIASLVALEAHKPMFRFTQPYRQTISVAFLPQLRKVKHAAA